MIITLTAKRGDRHSMQLSDFERKVETKITKRGRQYYEDGYVHHLEQINDNNWQAEVSGTEIYIVDIIMQEDTVTYTDCDCPYENLCKHIVAVLYEIKNQLQQQIKQEKRPSLKELLNEQSKERLVELILTVGKKHPSFMKEVELEVTPQENEIVIAERVIRQHLKAGQDRNGFIKWGKTVKALKGIELIQERIDRHIDEGNLNVALDLALLCLQYGLEALECGDDSSGDLSGCVEYSIELIHSVIEGNRWNASQKKQIFNDVEEMIFSEGLEQWEQWQLDLLVACIPLCDNDPCEQQFNTIIELLGDKHQLTWRADYVTDRIRKIKHSLKSAHMTDDEAERYLQQHPAETDLRERLIESAFEKENYEKVLQLVEQGMEKAGIGHLQWKEYAFRAQASFQNKPEMKKLAEELLLIGQREYYGHLKSLYESDEWKEKCEELLDALKMKNSYLYGYLIVEEQQIVRILAYCQQHRNAIVDYYQHLTGFYDKEVMELFATLIAEDAQFATNRSQYKAVAQLIAKMKLAGHPERATEIINQLKRQYYRRPAFVEELNKV